MTTQITKHRFNVNLPRLRDRVDHLLSDTFPNCFSTPPRNALLRLVAHRYSAYLDACTEEAILQQIVDIAGYSEELKETVKQYCAMLKDILKAKKEELDSIKGIHRMHKDFAVFTQKNFGLSGMEVLESYAAQVTSAPITTELDLITIAELITAIVYDGYLCLLNAIEEASKQANETRGIL